MILLVNKSSKLIADFAIREKFSIICLFSTTLFWLDAICYQISFIAIIRLISISSVIIPLVLFVSPKGYSYIRRTVTMPYKFQKTLFYIILVTFLYYASHLQYTSLFDETVFESLINSFVMSLIFFLNIIWMPLILVVTFAVLFELREQKEISINWKIFLFVLFYEFIFKINSYIPWFELNKFGVYLYETIFQYFIHGLGSGKIVIHKTYISHNAVYFKLQKWLDLLPVVLLLPGITEQKNIGLGKIKTNRKNMLIWTLSFMVALDIGYILKAYLIDGTSFPAITQIVRVLFYFLLVAIYEELVFRGILQKYLCKSFQKIPILRRFPNLLGICVAATLFAAVHLPFEYASFIHRAILGGMFGFLFFKTDTIWSGAIVHGTHNLIINSLFKMT